MVPLFDVTESTGGLEVIPDTNNETAQAYLRLNYPFVEAIDDDWLVIDKEFCDFYGKGQLVNAQAGDMILWDSRTIHGGRVGTGEVSEEVASGKSDEPITLARLSLTVCMTGKDRVKPEQQYILKRRLKGFNQGDTTTHWPFEYRANNFGLANRKAFKVQAGEYKHEPIEITETI